MRAVGLHRLKCVLPLLAVVLLAGCGREAPESEVSPPRPGPLGELVVPPPPPDALPPAAAGQLASMFYYIETRTFHFFWDTTDWRNVMTPDRFPSRPFASVAAIGFALSAYPNGIEN